MGTRLMFIFPHPVHVKQCAQTYTGMKTRGKKEVTKPRNRLKIPFGISIHLQALWVLPPCTTCADGWICRASDQGLILGWHEKYVAVSMQRLGASPSFATEWASKTMVQPPTWHMLFLARRPPSTTALLGPPDT